MQDNIVYMFTYWDDLVDHYLLLKSSMIRSYYCLALHVTTIQYRTKGNVGYFWTLDSRKFVKILITFEFRVELFWESELHSKDNNLVPEKSNSR